MISETLTDTFGEEAAENDFNILRLGQEAGLSPVTLSQDPFGSVSSHLLEVCREFEALLDTPTVDEPQVQRFLEEQGHHFLVSPIHRAIHPRRRLGGGRYIPDFVVQRADGEWEFVEIEAPGHAIYQRTGGEPSAHFTHAITQVEDWLRFVDDNRQTVEREDGLTGVYRPRGRVVAGRDRDLTEQARRRFRFKRAESEKIRLQTYDLLLLEARSYAEGLARLTAHKGSSMERLDRSSRGSLLGGAEAQGPEAPQALGTHRIRVSFSRRALELLSMVNLAEAEVVATVNNRHRGVLDVGLSRLIAVRWLSSERFVFVDSVITKATRGPTGASIKEVRVALALVLGPDLPAAHVSQEMELETILLAIAESFGLLVSCHSKAAPVALYSGPWDGGQVSVVGTPRGAEVLLLATFDRSERTAFAVWAFDVLRFARWWQTPR
jgi:hypothetical protein